MNRNNFLLPEKIWIIRLIGLIVLTTVFFLIVNMIRTPANFDADTVQIESGDTVTRVANMLYDKHIISSPIMLRIFIMLRGGEKGIVQGFYRFEVPENVYTVATRLIHGEYKIDTVRLTIPEGSTRFEISDLAASKLPAFNKNEFLKLTADEEGHLFPDTYFFLPYATAIDVFHTLKQNYDSKIKSLDSLIKMSGHSEKDLIIMASILEGEARQMDTRRMIAGVLWKRISIGMPLQVDTAFVYINGKSTAELTLDDLKIDSPYNTYIHKGLPVGPISNPGLDSIIAAATPVKTQFLYFLTDLDGVMHYAKTLDEHVVNKRKYLK